MRRVKIYTKTGDAGETGLFGGARVPKTDPRIELTGTLDELNASLGVALSHGLTERGSTVITRIQSELFTLGAELGSTPEAIPKLSMELLGEAEVARLEGEIDAYTEGLPELKAFILPGGRPGAAELHRARTICRRAERRLLALPEVRAEAVHYLNRLSDYLFTLARHENYEAETSETQWRGTSRGKNS